MSHAVTTGRKRVTPRRRETCLLTALVGMEAQLHIVAWGSLRSSFSETSTQAKLDPWPQHGRGFHGELVQSGGGDYRNGKRGVDCGG